MPTLTRSPRRAWPLACCAAALLFGASSSGAQNLTDAQARQILLANAWCSFSYSQISGTTRSSRVSFHADGSLQMTEDAQTYSSGYGGTHAGQSSQGRVMRWKVQQLRLLIDSGAGNGYQDVGLDAYRNSSGALILKAAGIEYAGCR